MEFHREVLVYADRKVAVSRAAGAPSDVRGTTVGPLACLCTLSVQLPDHAASDLWLRVERGVEAGLMTLGPSSGITEPRVLEVEYDQMGMDWNADARNVARNNALVIAHDMHARGVAGIDDHARDLVGRLETTVQRVTDALAMVPRWQLEVSVARRASRLGRFIPGGGAHPSVRMNPVPSDLVQAAPEIVCDVALALLAHSRTELETARQLGYVEAFDLALTELSVSWRTGGVTALDWSRIAVPLAAQAAVRNHYLRQARGRSEWQRLKAEEEKGRQRQLNEMGRWMKVQGLPAPGASVQISEATWDDYVRLRAAREFPGFEVSRENWIGLGPLVESSDEKEAKRVVRQHAGSLSQAVSVNLSLRHMTESSTATDIRAPRAILVISDYLGSVVLTRDVGVITKLDLGGLRADLQTAGQAEASSLTRTSVSREPGGDAAAEIAQVLAEWRRRTAG